ncbi:serine/threonine protein phosphatase [Bdellovibrio bacteriovorus]|uniref:tetratricopeptide repeat protein n=1 Tax=Bdellovibrio bacteriovorus TaxID=959 RepID=UPI0021D3A27E|nr:tetratricopeptide repeat protein [Bdellovibrio bacteriovorus]UXR66224.1 serine/threonine protein phosphatase [Bdellovibrio bacteriovorus]
MKLAALGIAGVFIAHSAYALDAKISQTQSLELELQDNSVQGESRPLRVRDSESGKVAQVMLHRRGGPGSPWSGFFIIQFFIGDNRPRILEFSDPGQAPFYAYAIPGQTVQRIVLFKSADDLAKFVAVQEKKQKAKPVVAAPAAKVLSPQAVRRLERQEREEKRQQEKTQLALETEQAAQRAQLLEQQAALSLAEKNRKKSAATNLVKEADKLYSKQDYAGAERKYATAVDMDPEEDSYYYRYGVTLYKVENYNKSLATLSMADVPADLSLEKDYYIALNHLKLRDYDKARKEFVEIRAENDATLSPMASFFAGNIEMQQQKFPEARSSMEYVLDNSKDPQLDRSAEDLLNQIDKMQAFYESKKEKYRFTGFIGAVYDGNVLNVAENNVTTDVKAYRLNYGASALAIWNRTPTSDFGTQIGVSDYYSMNTSFQGDAVLQTADPLQLDLSLPFHKEFEFSKRSLNWELVPTYRSIYMSPTGGTRSEVIRSLGVNTTLAAPVQSDMLMAVRVEASKEDTLLDSSVGDDDQSALRYGLTLLPTWILDLKGEKSLTLDAGYLINQAEGRNYRYKRSSVGLTYAFAAWWKSNASLRAEYSSQNYDEAVTTRIDSNPIVTAAFNKDLKRNVNWLMSVQYNVGDSDEDSYDYNKFVVTSLFTFTHSILGK